MANTDNVVKERTSEGLARCYADPVSQVIFHARGLEDGEFVDTMNDRGECEVLSDGSIAHVTSPNWTA